MSQETPDLPALVPFVEGPEVYEPAASKAGQYDLSRVAPERIERIARYLAAGVPIIRICHELNASPSTVYAVRRLRPEAIEKEREELGKKFAFASDLALGAFVEKVAAGEVAAKELSFAAAVFADKASVLTGQPSAIVQHNKSAADAKDLAAKLAKVIDVEEVKP